MTFKLISVRYLFFGREVLQEMCSVLPEDKQGPVLDDIRKISKERRRHRPDADRMNRTAAVRSSAVTEGGLTGVYKSTSELSVVATCTDGSGNGQQQQQQQTTDFRLSTVGGLMATVRAARRKHSMSATVVYNPAFYDAPVSYDSPNRPSVHSTVVNDPAYQPYLCMTTENGYNPYQHGLQQLQATDPADQQL